MDIFEVIKELKILIILIIIILLIQLCLILIETFIRKWNFFQIRRDDEIVKIREHWILTKDKRLDHYSHDYMYKPKWNNLFGLKFPKENDYQD